MYAERVESGPLFEGKGWMEYPSVWLQTYRVSNGEERGVDMEGLRMSLGSEGR
jgi:hypothetical protein